MRNPFLWGLSFSLVFHAVLISIVGLYKPPHRDVNTESVIVARFAVTQQTPRPTPTPRARPRPTPTPRSGRRKGYTLAEAQKKFAAPLRLHVVHTTSNKPNASTENRYVPPADASANGVPGGIPGGHGTGVPNGAQINNGSPGAVASNAPAPQPTSTCTIARVAAHVTKSAEPDFPDDATVEHAVIFVKVELSPSGSLENATIEASSHDRALDRAAIKAAEASEYAPEYIDCYPVGGDYLFRVVF